MSARFGAMPCFDAAAMQKERQAIRDALCGLPESDEQRETQNGD
jgi:hypothetical protein